MLNAILITLNILSLIGCLIWYYFNKGFEPVITFITLTGTLIALIYKSNKNSSAIKMVQKGGKNSTNYQAGKKIKIKKK